MSKIVIPKHSADVDAINAVLRIHYEADDWVKSSDFKQQLMHLIGTGEYPSSYPKKAQIPAYFGFIESQVSKGGRITERRITKSGKLMYEAILSNDRSTRQLLIMEALENIVFGRDNSGCVSSDSDIEPPAILIKCILDTGYCTANEYAFLVWSLNDKCRKYYESLSEVIKARNSGGIAVPTEASDYADWKPALAMLRWEFLQKKHGDNQKVMLHPEVLEKYSERLQKLKVYNIDKHNAIEDADFSNLNIGIAKSDLIYKPFKISNENIELLPSGHIQEPCKDIEHQNISVGDQVLFVDYQITHLAAYYSFLIEKLEKKDCSYEVDVKKQFVINKEKEAELVAALKAEDNLSESLKITETIRELITYENYEAQLNIPGKSNKDILPAYLIVRALLELEYLTTTEQDYLLYSLIHDKETYSDAIISIRTSRKESKLNYSQEMQGSSQLMSIQHLKDTGILKPYLHHGQNSILMNSMAKDNYGDMLRRLSFYAVDIDKRHLLPPAKKTYPLPEVIKALFVMKSPETSKAFGKLIITNELTFGETLVQGDYIIFIDKDMSKLQELFVFQIVTCTRVPNGFEIEFERRHVINAENEQKIIQMVRETNNG